MSSSKKKWKWYTKLVYKYKKWKWYTTLVYKYIKIENGQSENGFKDS